MVKPFLVVYTIEVKGEVIPRRGTSVFVQESVSQLICTDTDLDIFAHTFTYT
jgi:hypothetical protein